MIVLAPAFDWLTLTTYDCESAMDFFQSALADGSRLGMTETRVMQYGGWVRSGLFYGEQVDWAGRHGMFRASGENAAIWGARLREFAGDLRATRVDVQITVPQPSGEWFDAFYRLLLDDDTYPWRNASRKPVIRRYQDSREGYTIYVGSPKSQKMTRYYRKEYNDVAHLRMEVQLRDAYAETAWNGYVDAGPRVLGNVLTNELDRLPGASPTAGIRHFLGIVDEEWSPTRPRREPSDVRTEEWVRDCVVPALKRLARNGRRERVGLIWEEVKATIDCLPDEW